MNHWVGKLFGGQEPKEPEKPKDVVGAAAESQLPARRGLMAITREKTDAYKESIGLLQHYAEVCLNRQHARDPKKYWKPSVEDFAIMEVKLPRGSRIAIRVPGKDEAKALLNVLRKANDIPEELPNPIKHKERSKRRKNFTTGEEKVTYFVYFSIDDTTPEQCKTLLEKAIRRLGHEPDWKGHYHEMNVKDEAEFRKQLRELEEDDPDNNPPPPGQKPRISL